MPKTIKISAVINTKNEAKKIKKCLRSVKGFVDEIIVVDMHSRDDTVEIAKSFGAKVYRHKPLPWVEPARNYALKKAKGQWILLLDPDEYITRTLKKELLKVTQRSDINFVRIPRKNIIFGKWMRHSNMWPDYLIRFFKNDRVKWKKEIHSQPETTGNGVTFLDSERLAIRHNNYVNIDDFVKRALRYSDTQANQLIKNDYKLKISDFLLKPIQEFNTRFFASSGFKDGLHGLSFCLLQSFAVCLVYLKLWQKQGFDEKNLSKESFVSASLESNFEYHHWFGKYFSQQYTKNIFKRFIIRLNYFINRISKGF
jgi:(heptosyl)LPS beta-1,4-glucosyltransferase